MPACSKVSVLEYGTPLPNSNTASMFRVVAIVAVEFLFFAIFLSVLNFNSSKLLSEGPQQLNVYEVQVKKHVLVLKYLKYLKVKHYSTFFVIAIPVVVSSTPISITVYGFKSRRFTPLCSFILIRPDESFRHTKFVHFVK